MACGGMSQDRGQDGDSASGPAVLHVMVVGFHHQKGSTIEFTYPPLQTSGHVTQSLMSTLPPEWRHLPHLALPDGSHNYENDSVYFTLPMPSDPTHCVYGVACCRQIAAQQLHHRDEAVTRSTVQKSVCVLCRFPAFKFVQSKLELVTHAYFNVKDFSDVSILHEAYESMNSAITLSSSLEALHVDLSQRELVLHYQHRLLQVVKALLLRKRVVVYGSPANKVCAVILSIASLFPLALEYQSNPKLHTDDCGFPLIVFDSPASLQPYVCLQQMDLLSNPTSSGRVVLAGVVNPLFEKQQRHVCDVFVHMEQGLMDTQDPETKSQLHLTSADLRFCSNVMEVLQEHQGSDEPMTFRGSSEWVKSQYRLYLLSLLAASENGDAISMDEFNKDFTSAWLEGDVFKTWKTHKREGIMKVEPRHPCEGEISLGDVRRRLVARASDHGLNVQSGEAVVQETQRVITEAASRVSSVVSGAWGAASAAVYSWWSGGDQEEEEENS